MKKHVLILRLLCILLIFSVVFCITHSALAQNNEYDIGKTHFDQGRHPQAIQQWEQLLQDHPNYAEKSKVWFYLGLSCVELAKQYRTTNTNYAKQYGTKAIKYFQQILDQKDSQGNPKTDDPFYPDTIFYMGMMCYSEGERFRQTGNIQSATESFNLAKGLFNQLRTQYPDHARVPEALDRLGFIAICEIDPVNAHKYYTEAMEKTIDPELKDRCNFYNAWALAQLGDTNQAKTTNQNQAIRIFNQYVVSQNSKYGPQSLYEIANINFSREEYQMVISRVNTLPQAFPLVKSTTTSDPALLDVWHDARVLQANAYEKLGQYDNAASVMENVVIDLSRPSHPIAGKLLSDKIKLFNLFLAKKDFTKASNLLNNDLERTLGNNISGTGNVDELKLLKAKLDDAQGQYTQALSVLADLLGVQTNWSQKLQISKTPFNTGSTLLSESSFYEACKLMTLCYAKTGQTAKANEIMVLMYEQMQYSQNDYLSIADETYQELERINSGYHATPFPGNSGNSGNVVGQPLPPGTIETGHNPPILTGETKPINPPQSTKLTPQEQQEELTRCNQLILAGKDKEAEILLANFFSNDDNSKGNRAVAGLKYGEVLLKQGDKDKAHAVFESLFDECSGTAEANEAAYYLGLAAENDGDVKTARNYYLSAIHRQNKQCDAALYRLAALELGNGDITSGMKRLNEIHENHRDGKYWSHAAWLLVLNAYSYDYPSSRDLKRSEEILDEMLGNNPDTALLDRILFLKGKIAQEQEHWETAALAYETLIKLDYSPLQSEARRALNECRDKITQL